ncbi:MAG: CehA/McbA family metallohydrolase [Planctomycetales bacterium]
MKYRAAVITVGLLGAALAINASFQKKSGEVQIARLNAENWDAFAPLGKEVDAIYGDVVLRNDHLTAVIAQPLASRNANMTVRDVGGCLIDLAVRWNQSDQLSAFFPGARKYPYRSLVARDADGAEVDIAKAASAGKGGSVTVRAAGAEGRPAVEVTYSLKTDAERLTVTSRFTNETDAAINVPLFDDLRIDSRNEDIVKIPNGTTDLFWIHDRHWGQAYGIEAVGGDVAANSTSRTSKLQYDIGDAGKSVRLEPGKSFELVRNVFPGIDLPHVRAISANARGDQTRDVEVSVFDGFKRPIPDARVSFRKGDQDWGLTRTGGDGVAVASLPEGNYSLKIETIGVDITPSGSALTFNVAKKGGVQKLPVVCEGWKPGTVDARFVDVNGKPIPCKIDFFAKEGTAQPWFGPESGDFGIKGLRYAPLGHVTEILPAGEYNVVVAHGPEHDAIFTTLKIAPGETTELTGTIKRVVDTTGWISSDFHSHSSPSGDNTGSQLGRVLNLVCDHIEFAPCTEHNRVDSYQPHIDRLQIGPFISSCTGMELTGSPLLLNHQNAFPMVHRPHLQDGGGPVTDTSVEKQVERLALWDDRSEKLIQQNHPDMGWLYRDKDGNGEPDDGHPGIMPHIDVVEIHPVPDILTLAPFVTVSKYKGNNRIFNWLQMLNQGVRLVGVVNSDAHYNYHESGWIRNWIRSPTDDPAEVKPLDIVRASEAGALIMSNGPFLEVEVREAGQKIGAFSGQELEAKSGNLEIDVRVQSPNWIDIDRVFVLVNGQIHQDHHYRKETHPNLFRSGVVKFDQKLSLKLDRDAHVIVVAGADKSTLGVIHGPTWGQHRPAAFINPVFVDIDGNGFEPNKDTLGHPLPVRFGAKK